ncbi:type II secretion system protein GspD [Pseudomonas alloputida]|uniref:type II secretion system protein GspD n=1 Tax=Pseudomonas TaxID=286 RepID=UPI003EEFB7DE
MIRLFLLCLMSFPVLAADKQAPYQFDLNGVPIGQVAQIFYADAFKKPFMLSPEVLEDRRAVSLRVEGTAAQVRADFVRLLDAFGYSVIQRNGVETVMPKKEPAPAPGEYFLYRPLYRDVAYLAETLSPLFQGKFSVDRGISVPGQTPASGSAPRGSAASLLSRDADQLVFVGSKAEIANLRSLLPQVDVELGEVMLRSAVYEVQTGDRDGSAFSLAASLLKGKVSINLAGNPLDNSVSISTGDFNAVLSALSSDSRFKVVSQPSLRVRSGKEATINVGAEVPVLGALSYPQGAGQAVQSVEYRSSGVIFTITPQVRAAVVDLTVDQQLSNFVQTTTGVNNSPTLTKRQLTTNVQMRNSEVVMLGGLTEEKTSETQTGLSFLPSIFRSTVTESSKSEILLVIQMVRI